MPKLYLSVRYVQRSTTYSVQLTITDMNIKVQLLLAPHVGNPLCLVVNCNNTEESILNKNYTIVFMAGASNATSTLKT